MLSLSNRWHTQQLLDSYYIDQILVILSFPENFIQAYVTLKEPYL